MKFTKNNLQKLEDLFKELSYVVRYEKGNFQSGYCLLENKKVAVVNKFFDTEGRINCLLDILNTLEVDTNLLSEKSAKWYKQLLSNSLSNEEAETEETT